jgi:hypothetical protein
MHVHRVCVCVTSRALPVSHFRGEIAVIIQVVCCLKMEFHRSPKRKNTH